MPCNASPQALDRRPPLKRPAHLSARQGVQEGMRVGQMQQGHPRTGSCTQALAARAHLLLQRGLQLLLLVSQREVPQADRCDACICCHLLLGVAVQHLQGSTKAASGQPLHSMACRWHHAVRQDLQLCPPNTRQVPALLHLQRVGKLLRSGVPSLGCRLTHICVSTTCCAQQLSTCSDRHCPWQLHSARLQTAATSVARPHMVQSPQQTI